MNYRLIFISILLFCLGHIFVWMQLNGPILWPAWKKYRFAIALLGVPITYVFMYATQNAITGYQGSFCCCITIFTIFTYVFKGEGINAKTAVSLTLAFTIIILQLFWK